MAAKKRTTLREKSAKASIAKKVNEFAQTNDEEYHENPFLKLSKVSKKDKQQEKSSTFTKKIETSANTTGGISKSALRRRKRKAKEELKPKMNELLSSLGETNSTSASKNINIVAKPSFINTTKVNKNLPNAAKRTGHSKILAEENKNFNIVLQNPQFRSSPFDALKAAIAQNLKK